jgi:hypothetical protein
MFWLAVATLVLVAPGVGDDKKDKPAGAAQVVDSGSFGIFVGGKRVATEKFQIEKRDDGNVASSELTVDDGKQKASQTSELTLSSTGDLQNYSWKEQSPGKGEISVAPQDVPPTGKGDVKGTVVMEHITPGPAEKAQEVPFFVPVSTPILDDYFFSHRELLTWRYLGAGCQTGLGQTTCRLPKMKFGVIVPRQGAFITVSVEYVGREKVKVGDAEREFNRFNITGDSVDWALWLDDQHKLVRILIASDNTEVLRD